MKPKFILFLVCLVLVAIPFLWLKPGEIDIGGDSTRLYFYDPINFLVNVGFYNILADGIGRSQPGNFMIPFVALLVLGKGIVGSPYLLVTIFNSFKLVTSFIFIYLIVKEILANFSKFRVKEWVLETSSIVAGILYIFIPTMIINWDKALVTHNQIFLNPMIFYLLMKFVLTKNYLFLYFMLLTTVLFAPNFSWIGAPPIFSFFPLSLFFLFLYIRKIRKVSIPWKGLLFGFFAFLGFHAFHIIPQIFNLLDPGSYINTRVLDKASIMNEGVRYFRGILPVSSVGSRILTAPDFGQYPFFSVVVPAIVILGFLFNKKNKLLPLVGIFFLISLFFLTAKITMVGTLFYEHLFYIPGFSMFRNFLGQWLFVYSFFYAILFGVAFFIIAEKLRKKTLLIFFPIITLIISLQAVKFINGELINHKHLRSEKYIAFKMDPKYEVFLEYIRSLPKDGKILTLPFSDAFNQIISGTNSGAYLGPSTISYLGGKNDFVGYQNMDTFPEVFFRLSKEKDYENILKLLGILNIKYIFHNSDPQIYDKAFPNYPYEYSRTFLPVDQNEYKVFVKNLTSKEIYGIGPYKLYETKPKYYLPRFFASRTLYIYKDDKNDWEGRNMSFFAENKYSDPKVVYLNRKNCNEVDNACLEKDLTSNEQIPEISFEEVNPTKYRVDVKNVAEPYFLAFLQQYNKDWILTLDGKLVAKDRHVEIDGYANGWYIYPQDTAGRKNYILDVEMSQQKLFNIGSFISITTFILFSGWVLRLFLIKRFSGRIKK